ncbi:Sjoegren syndrome/scleroderma autoantigen 1-like isoform X2 [Selaginella moellendorffii]|uniref:Sjoegren syndrome/scleroderma autoantigen 1-like isoform X2 n=1 Tax=Selaginella moellendorffii TaxID=88036 RepID=UPI000D1D01CD|nr:Sjoegren syndrome/scleroderma autoantigen 1-like isoform X2 [Selaginella moellendorffii]|eukprot:XP_024526391.1 Sjoegren syndrome/scleroderma autoantigen 1-like isoform X2 [Selaginella moellendorffii]
MEERSEGASALIAAKMLQGWALLGEHCPACLTPLMRNKEKRMYCVSCQQWVVRENETAKVDKAVKIEKIEAGEEDGRDGNSSAAPWRDRDQPPHLLPKVSEEYWSPEVISTVEVKIMELRKAIDETRDVAQLKLLIDTLTSCLTCLELLRKN